MYSFFQYFADQIQQLKLVFDGVSLLLKHQTYVTLSRPINFFFKMIFSVRRFCFQYLNTKKPIGQSFNTFYI